MIRLVTLTMVLATTGCASVRERADAASAVALGLLTAAGRGDGAGACALLAPDTRTELEESAGQGCEQAIIGEDLPAPGTVESAEVYGQRAAVRTTGDTVFLAVFPAGWRVVAAGCEPRTDEPYDCALEG